nr:endothelin-converting enzyme homolog [Osmia lignaria]
MQIIWIFVFFGIIASGTCNILNHHLNSRWSFGANKESITEESKIERSLCTTKQCQELAKLLMEGMKKNINPCDDFYEYVCGNWKIHNPLPPDEKRWNLVVKLQRNVDRRLEEILKSEATPEDLYAVRFSKRAYNVCMDTDEMDKAGLQPLVSTLWRVGGWPLIMEEEEWDEQIFKWQTIDDYYANIIGLNAFHDLHIVQYWSSKEYDIIITSPHLPRMMSELITTEEIDMDSSDENNDSGEGSQEKGSEEDDRKDDDESEDDEEENDEKDEFILHKRKITKKKINKQLANKTRINKHIKTRTKRSITTRGNKHRQISDHKMNKLFKYKPISQPNSVKESAINYNLKNKREHENLNSDLYFNDDDVEHENINDDDIVSYSDNEEENGNIEQDKDNKESSGNYNDDEENEESGSGSGDYEDDDDDDDNDDDDDGSGSGNGDGEGDKTDEDNSSEERRKERMDNIKKAKELRESYAKYMFNVSMALAKARGILVPEEKLKKDVADLLEFEINLLKIVYKYGEELNMTLQLFQKKYDCLVPVTNNGEINWIRKVENLFISGGMEIDKKTPVVIPSFSYIKNLKKLLDKTPSKTIVNYVHWNFLSRVIKSTTKEMRDWYWGSEIITVKKRSNLCITEIGAEYSLGYEYVKKYFSDKILQTASDMIDDIEKEVEYQIKESTWMDIETKHFILDKLVYLKKLIGYPKSYRNNTIMNQLFKGLSVSRSHYDNILSIMRYLKWQKLKLIFKKEIETSEEFVMNPLTINAFFIVFYNAIEVTAADFQSPFFDSHQPWFTNFGAIGAIMAHEVNHGFDSSGRVFDKCGEYMAWLPAMAEAYEKRAECFQDQFTKYSVVYNKTANIPIEDYGKQTETENIADTMGLQAAFRAYQRRQRICEEPDPMLPGLENFSNEQLLFISFGNLWCEVADPEELGKKVRRDSHSLAPLRLIGSISNSEDFAKTFNCPEGSPMNPKKKCNIWK